MQEPEQQPERDFYQRLRSRMRGQGRGLSSKPMEYLLFGPDMAHLLVKLLLSSEVATSDKLKLLLMPAYLLSPLDLVPELFLGPLALLDDAALAAYVLSSLSAAIEYPVIRGQWAGEEWAIEKIKRVLKLMEKPASLWNRLQKKSND